MIYRRARGARSPSAAAGGGFSCCLWLFFLFPSSLSGVRRSSRGSPWARLAGGRSLPFRLSLCFLFEGRWVDRLAVVIALFSLPGSSIKIAYTSILFAYMQIFS